jgi:hypothetical protein
LTRPARLWRCASPSRQISACLSPALLRLVHRSNATRPNYHLQCMSASLVHRSPAAFLASKNQGTEANLGTRNVWIHLHNEDADPRRFNRHKPELHRHCAFRDLVSGSLAQLLPEQLDGRPLRRACFSAASRELQASIGFLTGVIFIGPPSVACSPWSRLSHTAASNAGIRGPRSAPLGAAEFVAVYWFPIQYNPPLPIRRT